VKKKGGKLNNTILKLLKARIGKNSDFGLSTISMKANELNRPLHDVDEGKGLRQNGGFGKISGVAHALGWPTFSPSAFDGALHRGARRLNSSRHRPLLSKGRDSRAPVSSAIVPWR
jgi:hypothetical protein